MTSRIHAGGHALRIARTRLLREWRLAQQTPYCWRCGAMIDVHLSGLHPNGATVGHITPVSAGGTDAYDNLALEHRRCNLGAGARVAPPRASVVEPIECTCAHGFPIAFIESDCDCWHHSSPVFFYGDGAALPPPSRGTVPLMTDPTGKRV